MALVAQLVSPERVLYEGEADMVVCRTSDGEIAFLPGHVPFVGALGIAKVRILLPEKGEVAAAVHGGFVEVSHDTVTILSDVAELPDQIDVVRAETAKERASAGGRVGRGERGGPGRPRPRRAAPRGRVRGLTHRAHAVRGRVIARFWSAPAEQRPPGFASPCHPTRDVLPQRQCPVPSDLRADPSSPPRRGGDSLPSVDVLGRPLRRRGHGGGYAHRPAAGASPPGRRGSAPGRGSRRARCGSRSTSAAARARRPRRSAAGRSVVVGLDPFAPMIRRRAAPSVGDLRVRASRRPSACPSRRRVGRPAHGGRVAELRGPRRVRRRGRPGPRDRAARSWSRTTRSAGRSGCDDGWAGRFAAAGPRPPSTPVDAAPSPPGRSGRRRRDLHRHAPDDVATPTSPT